MKWVETWILVAITAAITWLAATTWAKTNEAPCNVETVVCTPDPDSVHGYRCARGVVVGMPGGVD